MYNYYIRVVSRIVVQWDGFKFFYVIFQVIYVDDEGRPVTPPKDIEEEVGGKREEIDTRHLYAVCNN